MNPTMSGSRYPAMRQRRGPGRLLWPAIWLMLLIYVINNPTEAATNARSLAIWLQGGTETTVRAIVSFIEQVTRAP